MQKAAIFIVNSLSNGGAERVVINMANQMAQKDIKVFILTVYTNITYTLDSKIEIITLSKKKLGKIAKIGKIPFFVSKINHLLKDISKNYDVVLMTSHLLYSNLLSRLSQYKSQIIQVIHVSYQSFDKKNHFMYKKGIQFLYNQTPIVTVSKGCMHELLDIYQVKTNKITTIYNPINIEEIQKKSQESIDVQTPYILFVGRLSPEKRPEKLIDIFYQGKYYENYHLYLLGTGPLESAIREQIDRYHLEESVILKGWCANVYPYMKNASLLVSTSANEAFPMTLIEALACNCKVVSFDIPYGPNEILIEDLAVYLAKRDDSTDMIEKINLAMETYPEHLEDYVQSFSIEKINNSYMKQYKKWNDSHE